MKQPANKKVLVTGANGFIGSHLVDSLLQQNYRVRVLIRPESDLSFLDLKKVEPCYGDVREPSSLLPAVTDMDYVYHCAAVQKRTTWENYVAINAQGTANLLEACVACQETIKKVIVLSSLAAVGPGRTKQRLTEDDPCQPINLYGKSKREAELRAFQFKTQVPLVIIRAPTVYGPRNEDKFCSYGFIKRICSRRLILLLGQRDSRFSFIHVADLVRLLLLLPGADSGPSGAVFFAANPEPMTWQEFGQLCAYHLGIKTVELFIPLTALKLMARSAEYLGAATATRPLISMQGVYKRQHKNWVCDTTKARKILNFRPELSLSEGIRQTLTWYQTHGWL